WATSSQSAWSVRKVGSSCTRPSSCGPVKCSWPILKQDRRSSELLLLLCRQLANKLHCSADPVLQLLSALNSPRLDQHPAFHRPSGDVEFLDKWLLQRIVVVVGVEPDDQEVLPDANEHVAIEQEADAAKHLLLGDALLAGQYLTDAVG